MTTELRPFIVAQDHFADWTSWADVLNVLLGCIQRMTPTGDAALSAAIKEAAMIASTLAGDLQTAAEGAYDAPLPTGQAA